MLVKTQRTDKRGVAELLQTNQQTNKQTNIQTNTQTYKHTNKQTDTREEDDLNFTQVYKAAGGSIARAKGDD